MADEVNEKTLAFRLLNSYFIRVSRRGSLSSPKQFFLEFIQQVFTPVGWALLVAAIATL